MEKSVRMSDSVRRLLKAVLDDDLQLKVAELILRVKDFDSLLKAYKAIKEAKK